MKRFIPLLLILPVLVWADVKNIHQPPTQGGSITPASITTTGDVSVGGALSVTGATTGSDISASGCLKTGTSGNPISMNCDSEKNVKVSSTISANYLENASAVDGTAYYAFLSSMAATLPSNAEITNLLGRIRWYKGDNSNAILNGLEGVCSSTVGDESITCRGGSLRTYTAPGATLRTSIGLDASARSSYSGGDENTAESGTGFVGVRSWMAPYFTAASTPNITNFHAFWGYNEHTTVPVTNGLKLGSAGGGFTNDLNLQNGETIDNRTDGLIRQTGDSEVSGQLIVKGSATVQGNAFSVGGSTLAVSGGKVGIGTASPLSTLDVRGSFSAGTPGISITSVTSGGRLLVGNKADTGIGQVEVNISSAGAYTAYLVNASATGRGLAIAAGANDQSNPVLSLTNYQGTPIMTLYGDKTVDLRNSVLVSASSITTSGQFTATGNTYLGSGVLISTFTAATGGFSLPRIKLSGEGGYLVRMTNNQGASISSGTVVNSTGTTLDNAFKANPVSGYMPVGIVYGPVAATDSGMGACADGAECWVCVSGRCMAQYDSGTCARASWAGASDTNAALINCSSEPNPAAFHDKEVGHVITAGASGMAWLMVHFR